jgi:hypothetical protein
VRFVRRGRKRGGSASVSGKMEDEHATLFVMADGLSSLQGCGSLQRTSLAGRERGDPKEQQHAWVFLRGNGVYVDSPSPSLESAKLINPIVMSLAVTYLPMFLPPVSAGRSGTVLEAAAPPS